MQRRAPILALVTVLEAIKRSSEFLEKKGVESARLNAELLLAHALGVRRMKLYLAFERVLSEAETSSLRDLIMRRSKREPLQHITGSTSFCGHEIRVTPNVLTPRPETEVLAEISWNILKEFEKAGVAHPSVLDIGTGSACIPIAIARRCLEVSITSVDISPEALELAQANIRKHELDSRIRLLKSDLFTGLDAGSRFDLILSNPPYIPSSEISALQPEVRDFEPRLALDGGVDGLDYYRRLASDAAGFLKEGGKIALEFGDGQAESIRNIFQGQNWIVEAMHDDYTRRPRVLVASRHMPSAGS